MPRTSPPLLEGTLLALLALSPTAASQGWANSGGNAARNGRAATAFGPLAATSRWTTAPNSIIAWQPVVEGDRVFTVRQTGFPPSGEPNGSPIVCQSVSSGGVLWTRNLPYTAGEWTTWIAGVSQGRLFAARSGNGASVAAKLHALDVATGNTLWVSQATIDAGAYDGVVFTAGGDAIVASFRYVWRIRGSDGVTVWAAPRLGSVSGNCGAALFGNAIYVADAAPGGTVVKRFDLATGAYVCQSPVLPGFTVQNSPFVAPDGRILLSRTQNNAATDFLYCLADQGTSLALLWQRPAAWTTSAEFAAGDGIYHLAPGGFVERVDANGNVLATSTTSLGTGSLSPRMALDRDGRLFVSNGGFANGLLVCFEPDLRLRWSVPAPSVNIGGPALADDGTLLVALTGTAFRAYRTPPPFATLPGGFGRPSGAPTLAGAGTLTPTHAFDLAVASGPGGGLAALVLGASALQQPLFGGILVPSPDLLVPAAFALDAQGAATATWTWPAGVPPGTKLWFQSWMLDGGAPFGIAATNGLVGTGN